MNLENSPTVEQLKELLVACDDESSHHRVWVDYHAEVHVSPVDSPVAFMETQPTMKMRYETLAMGNNYTGKTVPDSFVKELLETLLDWWPNAKNHPRVMYAGW